MNKPPFPSPADNPYDALRDVCDAFGDPFLPGGWKVAPVEPTVLPPPAHSLLAHSNHMTTTLEEYYAGRLTLCVLRAVVWPDRHEYHREITLSTGANDRVVEFGVVRISLNVLPQAVAAEILEKKRPLGEILIRHDVLRRVEPRYYYRFAADSTIAAYFNDANAKELYGRVARIDCNGQPAIRMLEVVAC